MKETTQTQRVQYYTESIAKQNLKSDVKTYLLNPLFNGLVGFSAFFTLIILTKLFSYVFGLNPGFSITINDVIYSLTGFVMAAGIKFLEFFSKEYFITLSVFQFCLLSSFSLSTQINHLPLL